MEINREAKDTESDSKVMDAVPKQRTEVIKVCATRIRD